MPECLPRDGCKPAYALRYPLRYRRCHQPCRPPAAAEDGPARHCTQSEQQFRLQGQSGPGKERGQNPCKQKPRNKKEQNTLIKGTPVTCIRNGPLERKVQPRTPFSYEKRLGTDDKSKIDGNESSICLYQLCTKQKPNQHNDTWKGKETAPVALRPLTRLWGERHPACSSL